MIPPEGQLCLGLGGKGISDLFQDERLVEGLGGTLMRCDPGCGKHGVKGVPVVRP